MPVDFNLPCGYCCGSPPCGDTSSDHDDLYCAACEAVPISSEPHPECLAMVDEYVREHANDGSP